MQSWEHPDCVQYESKNVFKLLLKVIRQLLIPICTSGKIVYIFATDTINREWYSWVHKPGLTHLSLVCSPGPFVVLCTLSIANSMLQNWPIVSVLILFYFILFSNTFLFLVHDYCVLYCFPCYSVSCTNYNSIWPYNIVIHVTGVAWF